MAQATNQSTAANQETLAQLIVRTWHDKAFKERLIASPVTVLRENHIDVPDGIEVRVVENTESVAYLTLPLKPTGELTEAQLLSIAGAGTATTTTSTGKVSISSMNILKKTDVSSPVLF